MILTTFIVTAVRCMIIIAVTIVYHRVDVNLSIYTKGNQMSSIKVSIIILALISIITICTSCTVDNAPYNNATTDNTLTISSETEIVTDGHNKKYEKIRFGETHDILLLDVEWHTPESYEEEQMTIYGNVGEGEAEAERLKDIINWITDDKNKIANNELYIAKTINGIDVNELSKYGFVLYSQNPHNNKNMFDPLFDSQINPDGLYCLNIYPFTRHMWGIDENDEVYEKNFDANDELDFSLIADEIIAHCDDWLERGLITQEKYDAYAIKSPLDHYVRVLGLFDVEDLKNYPPKEYTFPPIPEIIKDKKEFNILYVGNSLVYAGSMPEQVGELAELYGITITCDTIAPPGALLSDTMEHVIESMQNNKYDYAIFQDGGNSPIDKFDEFSSNVERLCEEARKSGAIPVLYNPAWTNENRIPERHLQRMLTKSYVKAAKMNGAIVVNAGEAWVYAYDRHPDLRLYADDVHANDAGAYLTACVFASTLFDLHVRDVSEDNFYHGDDAIRLGQAAWEYVQYYNEHKAFPEKAVVVPDGTNEKASADK